MGFVSGGRVVGRYTKYMAPTKMPNLYYFIKQILYNKRSW